MKAAWKILLIYTLFVILWGAFVRATGSGDGCGAHWPSCEGQYLIENSSTEKLIEYTHRFTSGVYGIFVFALCLITFFSSRINKTTKILAGGVLFFTILEALIGAKLVLSGYVGENESLGRALIMIFHLVNTLFLVACNIGVIFFLEGVDKLKWGQINLKRWLPLFTLFFLTAASGGLAALGDTLYPSESLLEGFSMDFKSDSPLIIQLRSLHPIFAFTLAFLILLWTDPKKRGGLILIALSLVALVLGLINLVLMAPLYMQIIHLLAALSFWSSALIYFFAESSVEVEVSQNS